MPTDHRMLLGELIGERAMRHRRYCKERVIWIIAEAKGVPVQEGYSHFSGLRNMVKKLPRNTITAVLWISDATWRLVDQREALGRTHTSNQQARRTATGRLQAALIADRRCRVRKAGGILSH